MLTKRLGQFLGNIHSRGLTIFAKLMLLNNRYQILRSLGAGGFGETFIAEDTQMPSGRWCVLKKLRPISDDLELQQLVKDRFKREAAILEDLGSHSDQIPALYAYFTENGHFYLVQELIDGITLNQVLESQVTCSESYVREFLANFLPILVYVHSKHIIHRDIKPDNIIIRHQDHKPVLIDFGAVKEAMSTHINGGSTQTIVIGTPGFMPSEQAAGRPVYSSDLYATGLIAIYLLTGKMPQNIETDYATGEILWQRYAPDVSPDLAAILDKTIAPHARDRYGTAQEIIQALAHSPQAEQSIPPTVIAANLESNPSQTVLYAASPRRELPKTLLIGCFFAIAAIGGFWLTRSPSTPIDSSPVLTNSNQPSPSSVPTNSDKPLSSPEATSPPSPTVKVTNNSSTTPPPKVEEIPTPIASPHSSEPTIVNTPVQPIKEVLEPNAAKVVIQDFYANVSRQDWNNARGSFTPQLATQLDPNFFKQFNQVSVENLNITAKTDTSISFIGTTTYFYTDGAKQVEERSYTVELVNKTPLISASEFIRVVKSR